MQHTFKLVTDFRFVYIQGKRGSRQQEICF